MLSEFNKVKEGLSFNVISSNLYHYHSVSAVRLDSWYHACGRVYSLDKRYWALGTAKNNVY